MTHTVIDNENTTTPADLLQTEKALAHVYAVLIRRLYGAEGAEDNTTLRRLVVATQCCGVMDAFALTAQASEEEARDLLERAVGHVQELYRALMPQA